MFVTPNTLTETSNLLAQHADPEKSRFFEKLRVVIQGSEEVIVTSGDASRNSQFVRLGITDAALLEAVSAETPLVTVDLDLYLATLDKQADAAVNFRHLQPL